MHREVIGRRNGDLKSPLRNLAPFAKGSKLLFFLCIKVIPIRNKT